MVRLRVVGIVSQGWLVLRDEIEAVVVFEIVDEVDEILRFSHLP